MSQEPYEPPSDYLDEEHPPKTQRRRAGPAIDLTGIRMRIALTALVIGLGVLIISFILRPQADETPEVIATVVENVPVGSGVLATFTPGATSTPPPLDLPTPVPTVVVIPSSPSGELSVGFAARVTGTSGAGVNMRSSNSTTAEVLQILPEDTLLTLMEGPTEAEGFTWWKVHLDSGVEGWVVQDFLSP
ncbi:MAG: SH3 domain-containing protein [Ardenticatenales bacterium]|nr:SH3 domain-containing protein [Ardenticatenales bacterium]